MRRDFYYLPIITILTVIGLFLAFQNIILKNQASDADKRAKIASTQRNVIESISKQNRSYTRCLGEVFAKYTRDGIPITNLDLDTCTIDSQTKATNDTPTGGTAPSGQAPSSSSTASPSLLSGSSSPNSTPSQPKPEPEPSTLDKLPLVGGVFKAIGL